MLMRCRVRVSRFQRVESGGRRQSGHDTVATLKATTPLPLTISSIIQPRTPLGSHTHNLLIGRRVRPDDIKVIIRISRRILISKRIDDIRQSIVFPANQNVAGSIVVLHSISNAVRVVAVAVCVDCEAEVFGERLDGLVGTGAFAAWVGTSALVHAVVDVARLLTFLRRLGQDVADVVAGRRAEDVSQALGSLYALGVQAGAAVGGFLAVTDEVDCGLGEG
jgi:hypothetical protein